MDRNKRLRILSPIILLSCGYFSATGFLSSNLHFALKAFITSKTFFKCKNSCDGVPDGKIIIQIGFCNCLRKPDCRN